MANRLKPFRIHYKRRCTCATYDHHQDVQATSEKMALKKFWNYRQFPQSNSNKEDMEYERDALGFSWFDIRVEPLQS